MEGQNFEKKCKKKGETFKEVGLLVGISILQPTMKCLIEDETIFRIMKI